MSFIRKRRTGYMTREPRYSFQVIETYREGHKVRQRVLGNLGPYPSVDQALAGWRAKVAACEASLQPARFRGGRRSWIAHVARKTGELRRAKASLAQLETLRSFHPYGGAASVVSNSVPPSRYSLTLRVRQE
jgi:hypothetical protein